MNEYNISGGVPGRPVSTQITEEGGEHMVKIIAKKQLECPVCGFPRLIDAEAHTVSEMIPEDRIRTGWQPDYFQKCRKCGNQIGIKKVS